jgi:hypothetical protein
VQYGLLNGEKLVWIKQVVSTHCLPAPLQVQRVLAAKGPKKVAAAAGAIRTMQFMQRYDVDISGKKATRVLCISHTPEPSKPIQAVVNTCTGGNSCHRQVCDVVVMSLDEPCSNLW